MEKYKKYALLCAHTFPKRRKETNVSKRVNFFFGSTRKVDLNSKLLQDYKQIEDLCPREFCTYLNEKENEIVLSIRGTDLVFPEDGDLLTDFYLIRGKEQKSYIFQKLLDIVKKILREYPKYKLILIGFSLGGRLCIDLLESKYGKYIFEVHAFNPGTSIYHLYESNICYLNKIPKVKIDKCKLRENKLYIYLINGDPISVLSVGEKSKTKKIFKERKKSSKLFKGKKTLIPSTHSIMNFV